jgi:hypothetical protein
MTDKALLSSHVIRDENVTDYFRPIDRRLTEGKNRFGRIVAEYGHEYG